MILYLDTSALVKLYAEEPGSDAVLAATTAAQVCATHEFTYVEARSAFARKKRAGHWSLHIHRNVLHKFDQDWSTLHRLEVNRTLVTSAACFTDQFALRAYDAIQLASAEALAAQAGREFEVYFYCFDERLSDAAERLGLRIDDPIQGC